MDPVHLAGRQRFVGLVQKLTDPVGRLRFYLRVKKKHQCQQIVSGCRHTAVKNLVDAGGVQTIPAKHTGQRGSGYF